MTLASRIKPCRTLMVSCARGDSAGSVTYHCLSMRLTVYTDWFCSLKLKRSAWSSDSREEPNR
ncbi:hypothetical protein E2C01_027420 [Portunus trituberculatus]|uniref:Uncharacterized protein n=1 Tax=Portunus trituberculatus TaxID=210409 RepID=A0A5B7ELA7_PORTR|nr:hypothetical protein [Portunus trituberculatus]